MNGIVSLVLNFLATNLGISKTRLSYSLNENGLSERMVSLFNDQYKHVSKREATVDELLLFYSKEYLSSVKISKEIFENIGALLQVRVPT